MNKIKTSRLERVLFSLLILLFSASLLSISAQLRNGKLLRSELREEFDASKATGDLYVSPEGNDSWSGTLPAPNGSKTDGPFRTLERAKREVQQLKATFYQPKTKPVETRYIGSPHPMGKGKDIVVFIRKGFYTLSSPLVFTPEDGGDRVETELPSGAFEYRHLRDHYVTYAAYPGEQPVISGAIEVKNWVKREKEWVAQVELPLAEELIANGKKQTLARTPNEGYITPHVAPTVNTQLPFKRGDIRSWKEMEGNRVKMLLRWHSGLNRIIKVDEKRGIAYLEKEQPGIMEVTPRSYIENVKELMDVPGEWFYDAKAKELSYIPMEGIDDPNRASISVPQFGRLLYIKGEDGRPVRNLRFVGLAFEGATGAETHGEFDSKTSGSSAIAFEYAHACEFSHNELRACGGAGMTLSTGCYQTRITHNRFEKIEQGVINITGPANPTSRWQILRETLVTRNKIYDCGGINIYAYNSLHTTISHNYITKTRGRYAIDCGGWSNLEEMIDGDYVIEYNHLDDVQTDADDSGAIKVAGMTFNSVIRGNLIHKVHAGFFNDNVAFWFDNMAAGWLTERNIYYDLEQAEMKLCACYLIDNTYRDNFVIEPPKNAPETIIEGDPEFSYSNLHLDLGTLSESNIPAGSVIRVKADVFNNGATGMLDVPLYVNGKVERTQLFPVIKNNSRAITFELRLTDPGQQQIAIGTLPVRTLNVTGHRPSVIYEKMHLNEIRQLEGESNRATAVAKNLSPERVETTMELIVDGQIAESRKVTLGPRESKEVLFDFVPTVGAHIVRVGNSAEERLLVQKARKLDVTKQKLYTYGSAKARPFELRFDQKKNSYKLSASGFDFYHAEDAYAAVYLKQLKGDFVATVKLDRFQDRTNPWFRAGLFARDDISRSFDVSAGSKGSVFMLSTPQRGGIQYDEFGDGCMHKAATENYPEGVAAPVWIKLERHGNRFTGYVSWDEGKTWGITRRSPDLPGLSPAIDLGLAGGSPDGKQYWVEFSNWEIKVTDE